MSKKEIDLSKIETGFQDDEELEGYEFVDDEPVELDNYGRSSKSKISTEAAEEFFGSGSRQQEAGRKAPDDNRNKGQGRNGGAPNKSNKTDKKRKKRMPLGAMLGIVFGVMFLIAAGVYGSGAYYYTTHFLRGTQINGIDVSGMTYDELKSRLQSYELKILERGKEDKQQYIEYITGKDINIDILSDSGIKEILEEQSLLMWFTESGVSYTKEQLITYDEALLEEKIMALKGFNAQYADKPENAEISEYDVQKGYSINKETQGNFLKKKVVIPLIKDTVKNLETTINLDKHDCYMKPKIDSGNKKLNELVTNMNNFVNVKITYNFGEREELLDGRTLSQWMLVNEEDNTVKVDREKVSEYVANLRRSYDTIFRSREFLTTYGKRVTIDTGDYGWWMNYKQEEVELADQIDAGESGERTPVYYQTAAQYGSQDYGDSYVEINLTAQHLFVYVDGKMEFETDFCSGNTSRKLGTRVGVFGITYKERYGVLVGETYESTVAYWMPFDGDIGLHDAIWKTQFGSDFYKTDGSHGCINLPYDTAKKIYGMIETGTPVIVYQLKGTESTEVTVQSYEEIAHAAIEAIDAIGQVNKDSGDEIKTARYMYNKVGAKGQEYVTNYDKLVKAEAAYKALK